MENNRIFMKNNLLILGLLVSVLAGCATSTSYVPYTGQRYVPKDELTTVNVYSQAQPQGPSNPYYVIGKVSIEGFASSGVNPGSLTEQAKQIARKRGADAIINAKTEIYHYYSGDALLRFKGELIVYTPDTSK